MKLRTVKRLSWRVALVFFVVYLYDITALDRGEAEAKEDAVVWNYVTETDTDDVDYVLGILRDNRMGLSSDEEQKLAELIVGRSTAYDLDPYLVMALIKTESSFDKFARSKKGALGLMQLRPATGQEMAGKIGVPWKGEDTLLDPHLNVKMGIGYLYYLKNRFKDEKIAVAAYNRGPTDLRRRLDQGRGLKFRYVDRVYEYYSDIKGDLAMENALGESPN